MVAKRMFNLIALLSMYYHFYSSSKFEPKRKVSLHMDLDISKAISKIIGLPYAYLDFDVIMIGQPMGVSYPCYKGSVPLFDQIRIKTLPI